MAQSAEVEKLIKKYSTAEELRREMKISGVDLAEMIVEAVDELHDPKHCPPFTEEELEYGVSMSPASITASLTSHEREIRVRLEIFREATEALQRATGEAMADLQQIAEVYELDLDGDPFDPSLNRFGSGEKNARLKWLGKESK